MIERLQFAATGMLAGLGATSRARLLDRRATLDEDVRRSVSETIERVRRDGDAALLELAQIFDQAAMRELEVPRELWQAALGRLDPGLREAMRYAADNIARVHAAFRPQRLEIEVEPGVCVVRRPTPLARVGVYAPGGRAAYPSSILMGVIPARVAGAPEIIVCSPPSYRGLPSEASMAAAEIAGASRLFAVGGAGAIAAMALGTATIPAVDCIVGPGNAYVTEAKLQLGRVVRTDAPAGPSEVLIVADGSVDLHAVGAELVAQAEHGSDSCAVALLVGAGLATQLEAIIATLVPSHSRAEQVLAAFAKSGAILEAESVSEALAFADAYAPEHLLLATRDAASIAEQPRNAGSVFVGLTSSVVFGDYLTGANHVLPTAGYARTHSGLSTESFMRWTTVQTVQPHAAARLAPLTRAFAAAEGLSGHATAASRAGGGAA